jgi:hypothetical protein
MSTRNHPHVSTFLLPLVTFVTLAAPLSPAYAESKPDEAEPALVPLLDASPSGSTATRFPTRSSPSAAPAGMRRDAA